jgi:hypothetical protein
MAKLVKCRGCGQMISKRAATCPSCGEPRKRRTGCVTRLILLVIILGVLGLIASQGRPHRVADDHVQGPQPQTKQSPQTESVPVDGIAVLRGVTYGLIFLAAKDSDWDDFLEAIEVAGDTTVPLRKMVAEDRAFPCVSGTKVRVIKSSFTARYVVVLDGLTKGRTGWVLREFVKAIE